MAEDQHSKPLYLCRSCGIEKPADGYYSAKGRRFTPCKECRKAYVKQWVAANPERRKANWRRARARNPERYNEANRRYLERYPDRHRAACERWLKENPEKRREVALAWVSRNLDKCNAGWHRRRARLAGNGGSHTPDEVRALFEQQGGKCANLACSRSIKGRRYHVDHIVPLVLGGTDDINNIQLLCPTCNARKGAKPLSVWLAENMLLF